MSLENLWTISSSYDFQAHQQRFQTGRFSQTALHWFEVLPRCSQGWCWHCQACCQCCQACCRRCQACCQRSQACPRRSQTRRRHSQTCCCRSQVLPGAPKVFSGIPRCFQTYHNHTHGTPVSVIGDPSYSKGWLEYPSRVLYSPQFDPFKFTLNILSDTPGGFQWLKYILLMIHLEYIC